MACPGIKVCHHLGALVAVLLHLCGELILRLLFKQNQLRHTPGGEATGEATVIRRERGEATVIRREARDPALVVGVLDEDDPAVHVLVAPVVGGLLHGSCAEQKNFL